MGKPFAMMLIRPIESGDLAGLLDMARSASVGLTTLPPNEQVLAEHIGDSERAFSAAVTRPRGERYLLVMENMLSGQLVGCAGMVARVGGFDPFYSYAIETVVKASKGLGVHKEIKFLNLKEDHKGPSEIGTLFVRPEARGGGNGRLMSLTRFLFMAAQPQRFAPVTIAEMRGYVDEEGVSPFWEAIGGHFFEIDFRAADQLSANKKEFIADLMPRHPLYIPMLPAEAQAQVGQVHPETEGALKLLEQEGFRDAQEIDIFDGGPMVKVETTEIRSIKESVQGSFSATDPKVSSEQMIICNDALEFRACLGQAQIDEAGQITITNETALALGLRIGDPIRFVAARPS